MHARFGRPVLGYLRGALGDPVAAEDVLQQVLLEVWRRGPQYDPERGSLAAWVMTIARSRAIDELRRRRPEPVDPTALDEGALAEEAEADRLLERWRMAALLGLLPEDEAELLRLRFYDELTQVEIAERTGVALGTVKTRMVRALERLRTLLDEEVAREERALAVPVAEVLT